MELNTEKIKGLHHSLIFLMTHEAFGKESDAEYARLQKKVKMKGFRKGYAPLDHLRKVYADQVRYQVVQARADEALKKYYTDKNLRPAVTPKVDIKEDKKGLLLVVELDVLPEMADFDLSKIKLEKEIISVEESDIEDSLKNLAQSRQTTTKIADDRPLKKGDIAVLDFEGFIDGKAFENGKAERQFLDIGSNTFIPGFEDALVGKKCGQTEITVVFPKEYGAKRLAGKRATFKINVREIREKEVPVIDDSFAKELNLKDLDELKKVIREQLEKQSENQSIQALKDKVLDALNDKIKLDLPESLVEQELDILKKSDGEAKEKDLRKQAEQRVKLGLLLGDMGKKFNVRVSQNEMRQALIQEAMRARHPNMQQILKDFDKNPNQFSGLYAMIFEDKVLTEILSKITLTEKRVKGKK